jgi:hypothetical protein
MLGELHEKARSAMWSFTALSIAWITFKGKLFTAHCTFLLNYKDQSVNSVEESN